MDYAGRIRHYFGITGLDFRLTEESRERIVWASLLPFALLCAMLIDLSLDLYFGRPSSPLFDLPPEGWQRAQNASITLSAVLPFVCLAVLFLAGVSRWSRAEATWMLAIGAVLASAAVLAAAATTAIRTFELDQLRQGDLRVYTWMRWTQSFAVLAAGYGFIAYRGLAAGQRRRAPRPGPREAGEEY